MRLEIADYPVAEARLTGAFRYEAGKLELSRRELSDLVIQDGRIEEVSLAVVHPGEHVRVTGIRDIVEPRVKSAGDGQVFPGTLSPVAPVGTGRTHRLSGMAVIATAAYEGTARAGLAVQRSAILDMWGPGADASRFSSLVGLVLIIVVLGAVAVLALPLVVAWLVTRRTAIGLFIESVDKLFIPPRNDKLHIGGAQDVVEQPEFVNAQDFRSVIELINDEEIIIHVLEKHRTPPEQVKVTIGQENQDEKLRSYSVITTSYAAGDARGSIGVIGPRRMPYYRVIPLLDFVARTVSAMFTNTQQDT